MKKSKKYAAMMAAALLVSGVQLAGATTTYLGSGAYGTNYTVTGDHTNNSNTGDGSVGVYYVYTNGKYDKSDSDKAINKATFSNVTFSNNTITNTGTNATTGSTSAGAAVFVKGADVTFENVQFTNNMITGTNTVNLGGAVMVDGVRNNHNYTATATFKVTEDMTYSGNKVSGAQDTGSDTYGSVAVTSGGFLYLDRGSVVNFDIADGKTLTIGEESTNDRYTDSIGSSIKEKGQQYSENVINKVGTGTLTVNGEMMDYHGDLNVKAGTMNITSSLASDSVVSVASGATLNLKKLALKTSAEGTTSVVKPGGATENVSTPEKSGKLDIASGATVTSKEITASGQTSVSVGKGATLAAEKISAADTAKIEVASDATVDTNEITLDGSSSLTVASGAVVESTDETKTTTITANGDSSSVSLASGSNVTGNLYLLSSNAQSSSTVAGSFNGTIYKSATETLDADAIKKLVGYTAADTKAENGVFDIISKDTNHTVQMGVSDEGTFAIKSYDFSKTSDGQVQSAELGTWDAEGNYSAKNHKISDVSTLSAKAITLDGKDLAETLTTANDTLANKANQDMDDLTEKGQNQVKDYAREALEVKNEEGSGVLVSSKEDTENHKTTYTVSLDTDTIITKVGNGEIKANDTHLVSGDTLYTELRPATDGHYVQNAGTTATNLSTLDSAVYGLTNMTGLTDAGKTVIKGIAENSVIVNEGKNVKVTSSNTGNSDGAMIYTVDVDASGSIAASNEGLVNGGGLYTELRKFSDNAKIVSAGNTTAQNLEALGAQVDTNQTAIGTNASAITALTKMSNLTDEGKKQIRSLATEAVTVGSADENVVTVTPTKNTVTGNITYTVGIKTDGTVDEGNKGLVTGGTVYSAITEAVDEVGEALDTKANIDASNIGKNLKGNDGKAAAEDLQNANLDLWGSALGTGTVTSGSKQLVTGGTLHTELRDFSADAKIVSAEKTTAQNLEALGAAVDTNQTKISTNADNITKLTNMSNLTETGKTEVKKLASDAITLEGGTNVEISGGTVGTDGKKTYTVSVKTGGVGEGNDTLVTGGTVDSAIKEAIKTSESGTTAALATKANVDASNIGKNLGRSEGDSSEIITDEQKKNLDLWGAALGTGTVAATSNQLITGATLFNEVRLASGDYHYVAAANTTAANLKALDDQVYINTTDIGNLKNLSNISKAAKEVIQNANQITAGKYVTVNSEAVGENGDIKTTISVNANGEVKAGNDGLVTGDTVNTAINSAISKSEETTNKALANKVNLDASNIGTNLKESDGVTAASDNEQQKNLNAWGTALGTGEVAKGNGQLVTGDTMYNELRPTDGNYVKKDKTTADNLTALDTQVKTNADNIGKLQNMEGLTDAGVSKLKGYAQDAVQITGDADTGVKVDKGDVDKDGNVTYKVSIDTSKLTEKLDTNKLTEKLGTGEVAKDNTGLVTGGTVYTAIEDERKNTIGEQYGSTNNIEEKDKVKESIGNLDAAIGQVSKLGSVRGLRDEPSTIDDKKVNVVDTVLKLDEKVGNLEGESYNVIAGGVSMVTNLEQIDKAFGDVKSLYGDSGIKAKDGSSIDEKVGIAGVMQTVDAKIGDLEQDRKYNVIEYGNSVNANLGLIDTEIGTTSDGAYVSSKNSIGANLNALDQGLYDLNRGLSDLGDRVNKVGAGAAALAALHPEGFDPDDKLSFAVGFGHYKNANASAIGAFYKPNENTTFSVASTVGNGNTMVNAGVSFKLGKSAHVEKTMVAKADYEALQQKVAAQDEKMAAQDAEIEELKKQVALLVAKG